MKKTIPPPVRHSRWRWVFVDRFNDINPRAYVMDDFGTLVPITYAAFRITARDGDA